MKCKFYATCSCVVTRRNDQRSVRLHLIDAEGGRLDMGSVTVPVNRSVPEAGALVEIRYLYAYMGGSLYQPIFLCERDDLSECDCTASQLKYKPEGYTADGEDA